jgi:hypothetical protein
MRRFDGKFFISDLLEFMFGHGRGPYSSATTGIGLGVKLIKQTFTGLYMHGDGVYILGIYNWRTQVNDHRNRCIDRNIRGRTSFHYLRLQIGNAFTPFTPIYLNIMEEAPSTLKGKGVVMSLIN